MNFKLAILRFKWKDQQQANFIWNDNQFNNIFTPQQYVLGVTKYWQDCTFGFLNLQGSKVFEDIYIHDLNFLNSSGSQNDRTEIIQKAVQKVELLGKLLDVYNGVVVVLPLSLTGSADAGATITSIKFKSGKIVSGALLHDNLSQSFIAHEVGHVLNFEHSYGRSSDSWSPSFASYYDHYCIMSAMTFGNKLSTFNLTADSNANTETGMAYNVDLGPAPSTAMVYSHLPDFQQSNKVVKLNSNFRQTPVSLRLYSSHLGLNQSPILVTAPIEQGTNPFEKLMLIEYRASGNWDRNFIKDGDADFPSQVVSALVVHSIRSGIEYAAGWYNKDLVCLEGYLPIPLSGDTDISFSGARNLGILVNSVAPDLSYIDITIGRESWISNRQLNALIPESQIKEVDRFIEEGIAEGVVIPPNCGKGNFKYQLFTQKNIITLSAQSHGYLKPVYSWMLNGVQVPAVAKGTLQVQVISTYNNMQQTSSVPQIIKLSFQVKKNKLIIFTFGTEGNFELWVQVSCDEGDGGLLNQQNDITTSYGTLQIEGQKLIWEEAYEIAVGKCWGKFFANLPSAPIQKKVIKSDLRETLSLSKRLSKGDIILNQKEVHLINKIIKSYAAVLPPLGQQLSSGFDVILNAINKKPHEH